MTTESKNSGAHWNIWKTADKLEESLLSKNNNNKINHAHSELTSEVVSILREWGNNWAGEAKWMSLLNKGSLHHEVEESIVAIHHLLEGTSTTTTNTSSRDNCDGFIVMDICAGKGFFSFLLSYLRHPKIKQIVMLEKATINWHHITEGNKNAAEEGRPLISIWENTNLHDYDDILDRAIDLSYPVALSGMHLCKQLSPSFCGLVNGLGRRCIYACLTPCCMPTAVTSQKHTYDETKKNKKKKIFTLSIQLEETVDDRNKRRDYMIRRERVRKKPTGGPCFYCHDANHGLKECLILPTLGTDEQISIRKAWHSATVPCWNCLQYGHFKSNCPNIKEGGVTKCSSSHNSIMTPSLTLDVSDVLKAPRPYSAYCHLLSTTFQTGGYKEVNVIESELEKFGKHQEGNWNSERKSIFIIVK